MHDVAYFLREVALEAGERLFAAHHDRGDLQVEHKGRVDLVTRVDRELQAWLVDRLHAEFPNDVIVAEEDLLRAEVREDQAVWYLDPVDGTTNFVHGHPFAAISMARWRSGRPQVAAVHAPMLDELFLAEQGSGATMEGPRAKSAAVPLRASVCDRLDDALLATGFPYARGPLARLNLALCAHALSRARGLRRAGSAALDLCYVAAGRLDGYWEMALQPWDLAAGTLIAREAGAVVSDFRGSGEVLAGRRVCAAAPGLHRDLLAMIAAGHSHPEMDILSAPLPTGLALDGPLPGEQIS